MGADVIAKGAGEATRICAVVLGMHRSGTSAVTRALSLAGLALPHRLMEPNLGNLDGFWEPRAIVLINDQILAATGHDWGSVGPIPAQYFERGDMQDFRKLALDALSYDYGDREPFVIKDPRISRLVPFWEPVFAEFGVVPRYVCTVRNPLEVAYSLMQRDGFDLLHCLLMWLDHMIAAEASTRDRLRVYVPYEALVTAPCTWITTVIERLQLPLPPLDAEQRAAIESAVSTRMRHHRTPKEALSVLVKATAQAERLHAALTAASEDDVSLPPQTRDDWASIVRLLSKPELSPFTTTPTSDQGMLASRRLLAAMGRRDSAITRSVNALEELAIEMVEELRRLRQPYET